MSSANCGEPVQSAIWRLHAFDTNGASFDENGSFLERVAGSYVKIMKPCTARTQSHDQFEGQALYAKRLTEIDRFRKFRILRIVAAPEAK